MASCFGKIRKRRTKNDKKKLNEKEKDGGFEFNYKWDDIKFDCYDEMWKNKERESEMWDKFSKRFFEFVQKCIAENEVSPERMVCLINKRIQKSYKNPYKTKRNKQIMLDAISILLNAKSENRALVRQCLTTLYSISGHIDRELFMFEHYKENNLDNLSKTSKDIVHEKREELIKHLGGWKIQNEFPWSTYHEFDGPQLYLDLPYRRAHNLTNSHLMAEALYREQNPEFALLLLRHGVPPMCLYLWPICVLIDLKQTIQSGIGLSADRMQIENRHSYETKIIRYFCRARHFIRIHVVNSPEERDPNQFPRGANLDELLLTPPAVLSIVPEDRYLYPSSLMHQCRLAIRETLLESDCLPSGIYNLPVSKPIQQYIDLLED